jgi:hypothetical protein
MIAMGYTTAEGRQEILDQLAAAADLIGTALAELGEAYELVDDDTADRLETALYKPTQGVYGLAKRTHAEFSARASFGPHTFMQPSAGGRPGDVRGMIDRAADSLAEADNAVGELQDSMLPVEVGDRELRASLSRIRELLGPLPGRADGLIRTLGR